MEFVVARLRQLAQAHMNGELSAVELRYKAYDAIDLYVSEYGHVPMAIEYGDLQLEDDE